MAVIDHQFFPHLIDLIWLHTDYQGQLPLRSVCREWRERADRRLHHIVFQRNPSNCSCCRSWEYDLDIFSFNPLSRSEPLVWLCDTYRVFSEGETREAWAGHVWSDDELEEQCWQRQCLRIHLLDRMTSLTQTVDFTGFSGYNDALSEMADSNSFLELGVGTTTVRWFGEPVHLTDPDKFDEYAAPRVDVFMFDLALPPANTQSLGRTADSVPCLWLAELERRQGPLVVSYFCHSDPTAAHMKDVDLPVTGFSSMEDTQRLKVRGATCTVMFHNRIPPASRSVLHFNNGLVLAYCRLVSLGCVVNIVGLEQFMSENELEAFKSDVQQEVSKGKRLGGGRWKPRSNCLDLLSFHTHDEYKAEVGEEQYRIHTVR